MSAETLVTDLRELARAKAEESALYTAISNSFIQCIKLVNQHLPQSDEPVTPGVDRGSHSSAAPPHDPDIRPNRHRTKGPVFAIIREHGDWITEEQIAEELRIRGIPFVAQTLRNVLTEGVLEGKLERRGNAYRAVPIEQVQP